LEARMPLTISDRVFSNIIDSLRMGQEVLKPVLLLILGV
jgi:hypothetical protein